MKRSEIDQAIMDATAFFKKNGWALPPDPTWDITDFGLGDFKASGLVLVNLTEQAEYCEKIMYAIRNQVTPAHYHKKKKEDIICRAGILVVELWKEAPSLPPARITLQPGERVTIHPLLWHAFYPASEACMIGEVSTANDDLNDNFFLNPDVGRFTRIMED